LIADDDPVMRKILTSVVNHEQYEAVLARDGREAFPVLKSDANFKGALFDLKMPGLTGLDLVGHMKTEKRLQRIPVMIITAETEMKVMSEIFRAGAVAYLPKPFSRDQVTRAIRMLMHISHKHVLAAA
jgi:two-component system chemotaxis response regulator CheY